MDVVLLWQVALLVVGRPPRFDLAVDLVLDALVDLRLHVARAPLDFSL